MSRSNLHLLKCVITVSIVSLLVIVTTLPLMIQYQGMVMEYSKVQDFSFNPIIEKQQRHILLQPEPSMNTTPRQRQKNRTASPATKITITQKATTQKAITQKAITQKANITNTKRTNDNNHTLLAYSDHKSRPVRIISTSVNTTCRDRWCSASIASVHKHFYTSCEAMAFRQTGISSSSLPHRCSFIEAKGRIPVALVSVPGSGNTWARGLLEKATGICTGSIYCDAPLRNQGFVGEYVHDGSVLVVKTHTSDYQWRGANLIKRYQDDAYYDSAIFLIRNPFDTFVAERHRLKTLEQIKTRTARRSDQSHVKEVGKEEFGENKEWNQYIRDIGERWKKTILMWYGSAHTLNYPIYVLRYEDLKRDSLNQVTRMLDFLNVEYSKLEVEKRLQDGFSAVRRNHTCDFEHYTEDQKAYMRSMIASTMTGLQSMGVDYEELKLDEYLQ